jgi:hypothetical protein
MVAWHERRCCVVRPLISFGDGDVTAGETAFGLRAFTVKRLPLAGGKVTGPIGLRGITLCRSPFLCGPQCLGPFVVLANWRTLKLPETSRLRRQ